MCYSTLISRDQISKLDPSDYEESPTGDIFVRSTKKKGILPQILDELLSARKRAKKDMAIATDPMEKAVQNGRQLALKISANSVYGFTGAIVGQCEFCSLMQQYCAFIFIAFLCSCLVPCVAIASSVTAYGRNLLLDTKTFVETHYTVANGYEHNAQVSVACYCDYD